jgi:futalosine hydrolase
MNVIITAATIGEWMPAFSNINTLYTEKSRRIKLQFHQSGVGLTASVFSLTKLLLEEKPSLIIQVGLAGCFDEKFSPGKLFLVENDLIADQGVMEEGKWKDVFDLKLEKGNYPPYVKRSLPNPWIKEFNFTKLPLKNSVTVNQVSTDVETIKLLKRKYDPYLETMEGAALHYVARQTNTPFLQVRAVSNFIGERDKTKWDFQNSIKNLNDFIIKYVDKLYKIR